MDNIIKNFFALFQDYPQSKAILSIKVKNKEINSDRYAAEISVDQISLDSVLNILQLLNCSLEKRKIIEQYKNCSHVYFALEIDSKINYRVYFRKKYDIYTFDFDAKSFIAYESYKWDFDNNLKILETNYEVFRNLNSNSILEKIIETKLFLPLFIKKIVKENDIINKNHFYKRHLYFDDNFLFKSVKNNCLLSINSDLNSNRKAYNITYPLLVSEFVKKNKILFKLKTKDIFLGFENKKIVDITIGIDKYKENFMTFYFDDQKIIDFL